MTEQIMKVKDGNRMKVVKVSELKAILGRVDSDTYVIAGDNELKTIIIQLSHEEYEKFEGIKTYKETEEVSRPASRDLSEKEGGLLKFITENKDKLITVDLIKDALGEEFIGGIGRLVQKDLIEKSKKNIEGSPKMVKCFCLKGFGEKATLPKLIAKSEPKDKESPSLIEHKASVPVGSSIKDKVLNALRRK